MLFKITKNDKLKYFIRPLILGFLIDIVLVIIFIFFMQADLVMFFKLVFGLVIGQSILFNLPLSIFYFNYLRKNKDILFGIMDNNENFSYQNKEEKITFVENDIKKVILHLSPPLYDKRTTWLYWDDYFYSEIITIKGTFKIGCLVINNLEDYIKDEKVERRKVYFPLIN